MNNTVGGLTGILAHYRDLTSQIDSSYNKKFREEVIDGLDEAISYFCDIDPQLAVGPNTGVSFLNEEFVKAVSLLFMAVSLTCDHGTDDALTAYTQFALGQQKKRGHL